VNSAALRAAERLAARSGVELAITDHVQHLPHFTPDQESDPPEAVRVFRRVLEQADAVVLAVPEYAFGIPGAFKNAIDWTVGSGSLDGKHVAVLSVAPPGRGTDVRHALGRVLTAINAHVTHHSVPVKPSDRDAGGEIRDLGVLDSLAAVVAAVAPRSAATQGPLRSARDRSGQRPREEAGNDDPSLC
jgi:NAD(P)H-dependent FMN reductase